MQHAEIIHDYNYAQVLTLNLARKGFRVKEVPIPYHVRSTGASFITFRGYLSSVLPAIWKEWNRKVERIDIQKNACNLDRLEESDLSENSYKTGLLIAK